MAGDRLGGHLVNGHVDGRANVVAIDRKGESWVFVFEIGAELSRYLIEKGSVAVNGVSLTINRTDVRSFEVNVIPHTFQVTTMGKLRVGDEVNIEVDIIGKYVEKFVGEMRESNSDAANGMGREFLKKHGFL